MARVDDVFKKIAQSIDDVELARAYEKSWKVIDVKDGVATVSWLTKVSYSEIVTFEWGTKGLVLELLPDVVGVLILWSSTGIVPWSMATASGSVFSVWVGKWVLGRVVNGLGAPIDGLWIIKTDQNYPVEKVAPRVIERKSVDQPLQTWIMAIDTMVPIGRWQRELIIGDRQTWKTTVAIDTILAQKWEGVFCIYVAIGQKDAKVARLVNMLRKSGAMDYTIIVNAPSSSPAVEQYLAPYVWTAYGEYFMNNGMDALIIYDDLSKHAVAYREMSLLMKRPPGREAFPWDVFYLHSRLLERSARLDKDYGWGSLTALPIVETQAGDISAYIPTNVISITDGQIFLESRLFNAWVRPAINVWLSVSRVWWAAQTKIIKKLSWWLKLDLATYRELQSFAQFGSDLDPATKAKLEKGERLVELLKQMENKPYDIAIQAVLMYAWTKGYLKSLPVSRIASCIDLVIQSLQWSAWSALHQKIMTEKALTDDIEAAIKKFLDEVLAQVS